MQNPYKMYQKNQNTQAKPKKKQKVQRQKLQRPVKNKKENSMSSAYILLSAFGLFVSFYIFFYTDEVLNFVSRFDVSMTSVMASDEEKVSAEQKLEEENNASLPVGEVSRLETDANNLTMENASVFNALKNKQREIEKKERDLARLEEDLQKQKIEIEKQLKELDEMRRDISSVLDKKVIADKESVEKLVGVYSNMKPGNAAKIMAQIDEELAVKVLSKMKKQSAAEILNFMEPNKAQSLSEKYVGLKK